MKICSSCKLLKSLDCFSKNKAQRDGYHNNCKSCRKKYYENNKDSILAKRGKYVRVNKDKIKLYFQKPHIRERYNKWMRKWKNENKDKVREAKKKNYLKHKSSILAKDRIYRNTPKGTTVSKNANHKHRAKMKFTDIDSEWLNELWNKTTHCELCKCEMDNNGRKYPNGKQLDHILPLEVNGTHTKNNVRFICLKCNVSRPKDGSDLLTLVNKKCENF